VLLFLLSSATAGAESAEDRFREAVRRYTEADFKRSLELLREALELAPGPALAWRIELYRGVVQAVLGQREAARAAFRRSLALNPLAVVDSRQVSPSIVGLFEEVKVKLRGRLAVSADRPGARVLLDGRALGSAPLDVEVAIGAHQLELRSADGCRRHLAKIVVAPERRVAVSARLEVVPDAAAGCTSTAEQSAPAVTPAARRRVWTWVTAAGAGALLAAGLGLRLSSSSDYDEYWSPGTDARRGAELADRIESRDLASSVLFGVGAGLAVTAVALFFLEARAGSAERRALRVDPLVGRMAGGLAVGGRF
jgi:tetratricopeptide (TPR) repeat protein